MFYNPVEYLSKGAPLSFTSIEDQGEQLRHVLTGLDGHGLLGFDPVDLVVVSFEPAQIRNLLSISPAAVFCGVDAFFTEDAQRLVANPAKKALPRYGERGGAFPELPKGVVSGYSTAAKSILRFREEVPSLDNIRRSALFALSTVRVSIEEAEASYECFEGLYSKLGRLPSVKQIAKCFTGLRNAKARAFHEVAAYAPVIEQAIKSGLKDRALRKYLCLETDLPPGLGLAKVSFVLALLGHDTVCIDGRLLSKLFSTPERRAFFEQATKKSHGRLTELKLKRYEALEDAFLRGNRYYDPRNPVGRARAQWLSWEAVGGAGAEHSVWLKSLKF